MANRRSIAVAGSLLAVCAAVSLAGAEADPAEVLRRVTAKVRGVGKRLPNFTCVETVTREEFRPSAAVLPRPCPAILDQRQHPTLDLVLHSFSIDRLRLDVTMTDRGEIFSWAGARQFNDAGIWQVVNEGPIGTGAFGGFLLAIFEDDAAHFTFSGQSAANGRHLLEYRYDVPLASSHYRVEINRSSSPAWAYTSYSGEFQADADTADVVLLTVRTGLLPVETGSCTSSATLQYAPTQIGAYRIPLPVRVQQRWVAPTGKEDENTTAFTACREYKGESTLSFLPESAGALAAAGQRPPPPVAPLPPGLHFSFVLTAPLPTATAAAGDRVEGKLAEPMRDARNRVVAPKGAVVEGRLLRVERFRRPPCAILSMRPDTLEVQGVRTPLAASIDLGRAVLAKRANGQRRVEFLLPPRGEDRTGLLRFPGEDPIVPQGFRADWLTMAVPADR